MDNTAETLPENSTFYIGLCMAGAISAGAYTAGVLDYLIEALDRWEQARASGDPRVPTHRVMIDLMTGASAGGMTAAIATAALHDNLDPVTDKMGGYQNFSGQNKLYEAWVKLVADEMLPVMLDNSDLPEYGAASLFNSNFIDRIAEKMLQVDKPQGRPYVAKNLELCLSLSNLTGFQEIISFDNDSEKPGRSPNTAHEVEGRYISYNHRDFGHFIMGNRYQQDGRIPFQFGIESNEGVQILRDCAMATGAFPIGLRWRAVRRLGKYLNQNPFINYLARKRVPEPIFGIQDDQIYESVNVDGGLLNNEPFEIAHDILRERHKGTQDEEDLVSYENEYDQLTEKEEKQVVARKINDNSRFSVIMVQPFPSVENDVQIRPKTRILLKTIIGEIYSTMRTQLRFKQGELDQAVDQNVISKYIITPTRKIGTQKFIGSAAIACGSLGGFGGFLTQTYREHDFQLGRVNCQNFLKYHFRIEADTNNVIFRAGYRDEAARSAFLTHTHGKHYLPIIPDIDLAKLAQQPSPENLYPETRSKPDYPMMDVTAIHQMLDRSHDALKSRLFEILKANGLFSNVWVGLGIRLFKSAIMGAIASQVEDMVIEDLFDHKLVKRRLF
jgi:hypothetical protein